VVILKEYRNNDIVIYWYPELCTHPGICVRNLPDVFNPRKRPWINVNGASPEEIIRTIDLCPSGALRYSIPQGSKVDPEIARGIGNIDYKKSEKAEVKIKVTENGPLCIEGRAVLIGADGKTIKEDCKMALCSCGHSSNRPFCDGSHRSMRR